ncbi:TRAP transporter small permease [Pseudovibrio exalbescens]|uniref:TRAP transporter small permease protein n=1 Tax=Pseudovibrio exalbescens TaxID=197461 RepID=A0A1U7JGL7_9HYPH|nr:TRAP transporter small permease [Pseudovibrio exalbescens]OKL43867.1 hypothetical protein A3843_11390 [Pseudovibrio exalbescens]
MRSTKAFLWYLDAVMEWICHSLLVGILVITVMQVFMRFVLNSPTSWSEEIALLMLIWFGLIACGIMVGRRGHIAITFLRDLVPGKWPITFDLFADIVVLIFSVFLLSVSEKLLALVGLQIMPASGVSRAWLYWPVAVGGALMTINAAANVVETASVLFTKDAAQDGDV